MSDTDPDELRPVMDAIDELEVNVEREMSTIRGALHSLRSIVLEHYQRMARRGDRQDRRLDRIEKHLGLPELPDVADVPTSPDGVG